jgi:hypothetical protein
VVEVKPFAAYCTSVARWQQAEEALAAMAERDPVTGALLVKKRRRRAERALEI